MAKNRHYVGSMVIILCSIRFAAEIIVPFILALFIAVILNPLVQHMVTGECRVYWQCRF